MLRNLVHELQFITTSMVDEDKVNAHYKDGVLTVSMPKSKEALAMKIAVKA
ncbi:Hsp20 family protein [Novipirellula sp.]|uniref:Hsp20 family protein n=1 Tax=Novipirellula sp. TaxID=2795430 RepID=UPI003566172A